MFFSKVKLIFIFVLLLFNFCFADDRIIFVPNSIDWNNKKDVVSYVKKTYPKIHKDIVRLIEIESSFRPFVEHPKTKAFGFMQITKICSKDVGISYDLVREYQYVNIHAGVLYFKKCLKKAGGNFSKAYRYYNFGLYCDDLSVNNEN